MPKSPAKSRSLLVGTTTVLLTIATVCAAGWGASSKSDGIGVRTGDGPTPTAPVDPSGLAADQVVWQVDTGGGFVPYQITLTDLPELTIYGDGRAFLPADIDSDSYRPGHSPGLELGKVSADELAALVRDAHRSGLIGEDVDYGAPNITDQPSTVVRLDDSKTGAGGKPAEAAVYAFGLQEGTEGGDFGDVVGGVDASQAARRAELQSLIDHSIKLVSDRRPWVPDRVQVQQLDRGDDGTGHDGDGAPTTWPAAPLAELLKSSGDGRATACSVVIGADAAVVAEADAQAKGLQWDDHGDVRSLAVRPLLPGEEACSTG